MNTEKVFTAFDKNNNELLLYRKDQDTYIDLNSNNNEIYPKENIDLETLKYLSKSLKVLKYMPEKLIKKLYNIDREKTLETKNILLGIKSVITDLKKIKTESGWYFKNVPLYNYHYDWNTTDNEFGMYIFKEKIVVDWEYEFNTYKNILDNTHYIGFRDRNYLGDNKTYKNISALPQFDNGMEYVFLNNSTLYDAINEPIIEKKKVYEYANKLKKEKVEYERK